MYKLESLLECRDVLSIQMIFIICPKSVDFGKKSLNSSVEYLADI